MRQQKEYRLLHEGITMAEMYYIRVDANDNIGIGHMMRCLSIAKALRGHRVESTFFVADRTSAAMAAEAGFGYVILNTDYDRLDLEADRLVQRMQEKGADNLLVDSYYVTAEYLRKIRQIANVTYIDDIDRFIYPCDTLINYNIYADQLRYPERYKEAGLNTRFALGTSYMPLRDEYKDLKKVPHEGFRILVTTGATDQYNVIGHVLDAFRRTGIDRKAQILAIVGRYNHNRAQLEEQFGGNSAVKLIGPQESLSPLIAQCDAAMTAGGTTVYELCAGGIPAVMLTIADNQMRAAKTFSAKGIIPYAGDVRTDMDGTTQRIAQQIRTYMDQPDTAAAYSSKERTVVDGQGAERIAQLLLKTIK